MKALDFKYNFQSQFKDNEIYNHMNNVVENELYLQANKRKIEI